MSESFDYEGQSISIELELFHSVLDRFLLAHAHVVLASERGRMTFCMLLQKTTNENGFAPPLRDSFFFPISTVQTQTLGKSKTIESYL
jgi:hypothetical protein